MSNSSKKAFRDSCIAPTIVIICLITFVGLLIALLGWFDAVRIQSGLEYDHYSSLFVDLFIITVIVERFIEVFNSIWRRKGKLEHVRNVEYAQNETDRENAQRQMDIYRARTETLAMYTGFGIGIIIGICGFHTLHSIFDFQALRGLQKTAFLATDIVLTAGLIAGGSKGINAVTSLVGGFLQTTKDQTEKQRNGNKDGEESD